MAVFKSTRRGPLVQGTDIVERPPKASNDNTKARAAQEGRPMSTPWVTGDHEKPFVVTTPREIGHKGASERQRRAEVQPGLAYAPARGGWIRNLLALVIRTLVTLIVVGSVTTGVVLWGDHIVDRVERGDIAHDSWWALRVCNALEVVDVLGWNVTDKKDKAQCTTVQAPVVTQEEE